MDLLTPEGIKALLAQPFVVMYWPGMIGAAVFFATLARGAYRYAVPVALVTAAAQAWHAGWLE